MKRKIYKQLLKWKENKNSGKADSIYKEISYKLLYIIHYR